MALPKDWPVDAKGRPLPLTAIVSAIPAQGPRGNVGDDTAARVVARLRELGVLNDFSILEIVEQSNGQ
jgi:hypothetical protein